MPLASTTAGITPPAWFPLRWQLEDGLKPLQGRSPLAWWSAGWYEGSLRSLVLQLRNEPRAELLQQPLKPLLMAWSSIAALQAGQRQWLLVPIPTWRKQANPVPALLATALLGQCNRSTDAELRADLLLRSRRVKVQHRLARPQRWDNQWLSFRALLPTSEPEQASSTVLLIDDVLTSGATALAAQHALQSAGWSVSGLLCLARTPRQGAGSRRGVIYDPGVESSVPRHQPTTSRDSSVGRAGD